MYPNKYKLFKCMREYLDKFKMVGSARIVIHVTKHGNYDQ